MTLETQNLFERAYVSALMMAPHVGATANTIRASLLEPEEVYEPQLRKIVAAAHRVLDSGGITSFLALVAELDPDTDAVCELTECAGIMHLGSLSEACAILRAKASRAERARLMAKASGEELDGDTVDEDELGARLRELRREEGMDAMDAESLLRIAWLRLSRADQGRDLVVRMGHPIIDDAIGGLDAGGMTVVGARPSVGKSTLALDIACRSPARVCIVSVEDPAQTWATRFTAKESGVDARAVRAGTGLHPNDFQRMGDALGTARHRKFHVVDASGKTSLGEVRAAMRVHHRKHHSQVYVVDYAQAVTVNAKHAIDARERINRVIEGLKSECAQLGAHLVLLSQLRRVDDERSEPSRMDLKESGKFEEAAENILLLWRNKHGTVCGRVAKAKGGMPGLGFVLPQDKRTMAFSEAGEMTFTDEESDDGERRGKGKR